MCSCAVWCHVLFEAKVSTKWSTELNDPTLPHPPSFFLCRNHTFGFIWNANLTSTYIHSPTSGTGVCVCVCVCVCFFWTVIALPICIFQRIWGIKPLACTELCFIVFVPQVLFSVSTIFSVVTLLFIIQVFIACLCQQDMWFGVPQWLGCCCRYRVVVFLSAVVVVDFFC